LARRSIVAEGERAGAAAKAFWGFVIFSVVGLTVYGLAYLLIRDVAREGPGFIMFEYPDASSIYATSEHSARELYLAQLRLRGAYFGEERFLFSGSWVYAASEHESKHYWRFFGPLERLEIAFRGLSVYELSDAERTAIDKEFEEVYGGD